MPASQPPEPALIAQLLGSDSPWRVECIGPTGSTNADLAQAARGGEKAGSVIVSTNQGAGRGRFDRAWSAPPDTSIAVSVLVHPKRSLEHWGWLSLICGMAVAGGLREIAASSGNGALNVSDSVQLKWPNDVLIADKKVCGILCEHVASPQGSAAICGWGLNMTMDASELPVPTATSLLLAGVPTAPEPVLAAVLTRLAELFDKWNAGQSVADDFATECSTIGRDVRVQLDGQSASPEFVEGRAVGIGANGELIVDVEGTMRVFSAGDVVHLRPNELC